MSEANDDMSWTDIEENEDMESSNPKNYTKIDDKSVESWYSDDYEKPYCIRTRRLRAIPKALDNVSSNVDMQYCATGSLPINEVSISIEGKEKITFPIDQSDVEKLKQLATLAHFGKGEQTITDTNVRNTLVVTPDKINVEFKNLEALMNQIKTSLNLEEHTLLIPHLHNMLIYEMGQFFDYHQDTEKLVDMVATLVICLPCPHIGGDLIIDHFGKSTTFSTENLSSNEIKYAAFYSDCRHKVEKVKDGNRIVLTYNLVIKSNDLGQISASNKVLFEAIKTYFGNNPEDDEKLVYLLDHYYTKSSLKRPNLKGHDRHAVSQLEAVAKSLNFESFLAFANVTEKWHGYNDDPPPYGYEGDFPMFGNIDAELEIIEGDAIKSNFGNHLSATSNEICWRKNCKANFKGKSEEVEYTGNEGCSTEKSYKRSALILVPRNAFTMLRFKCLRVQAVKELKELTETVGNECKIKEIIKQSFGAINSSDLNDKEHTESIFQIAVYIQDTDIAKSLLTSLKRYGNYFYDSFVTYYVHLKENYGDEWCQKVLAPKTETESYNNAIVIALAKLLPLGFDQKFCVDIIDRGIASVERAMELKTLEWSLFYDGHDHKLQALMVACIEANYIEGTEKVYAFLKTLKGEKIAEIFFNCLKLISKTNVEIMKNLKNLVLEKISEIRDKYRSALTDSNRKWIIDTKIRCQCSECLAVNNFLKSNLVEINLPIKASRRRHVLSYILMSSLDKLIEGQPASRTKGLKIVKKQSITIHTQEKLKSVEKLLESLHQAKI